jgi:hypothetical protein
LCAADGLRARVANPLPGEQLAEGAAVDVGEGIVRHHPPDLDPALGEEGERPLEEGDAGLRPLVGVDLGVGKPPVVVDDRVREVVTDPALDLGCGPRAVAVWAGQLEG